jgi:hypothetical protein
MTFEEWWKQRSPFMPHLIDDFEDWPAEWKVKELALEAYEAGRKKGYLEGHNDGYKIVAWH